MSGKKNIKTKRQDLLNNEEESGSGDAGGGSGRFIPTYNDLIPTTADESALASGAADALFLQRVSLKSEGYKVSALEKLQKLREKISDPAKVAELTNSGGSNMATHPELAELGGAFDDIAFPESEAEAAARASNDPQLRNRLVAKLSAKFGMGRDLTELTMKQEYENKQKLNKRLILEPELDNKPRFRAAPTPKPNFP